ncbi:Isocitrate/isopropylmalate dehydrogenase-domain-containing protein [Podospora australis]|uniref:3-isopropylmalate dehydrogenase n=1 Tax=Podospora australis TaxID=1536484 RepID=A0AAN6WZ76_9PEZI|nr:Isocitrate/isopropylmalate dehydrogenase-domain-containing protein [Podospora australis]
MCHPRSFGDPNAQPPTPKQTPTSSIFPSPVFETPKTNSGRFDESSGWTPRFAEEYSVFNSTPGNLRGGQGPFPDFGPATSYPGFSPNPTLQLPSVEPADVLRSSPSQLTTPTFSTTTQNSEDSGRSAKKARRGTIVGETQGQTATPPPSARKGERKLAPKLDANAMQNDQGYGQPDFLANAQQQQQNMGGFVTTPTDMFGYPLSAPAAPAGFSQRSFWDTDPSVGSMDVDFGVNGFQDSNAALQQMDPNEWARAAQMMQAQGLMVGHGDGHMSMGEHQPSLISQAPMPALVTSAAEQTMFAVQYQSGMENPFGISGNGNGNAVDPGLLFSRPQSANLDTASLDRPMHPPIAPRPPSSQDTQSNGRPMSVPKLTAQPEIRRSSSTRNGAANKPDRALAASPIKSSGRPGLTRSFSENRGKKGSGRPALPTLAPAPRPQSQLVNNAGVNANRPVLSQPPRSSGRSSPLKSQQHQRLPSLTSIPETSGPRMRTEAKFTIDANGRARVETTVIVENEEPASARKRHSTHSSHSLHSAHSAQSAHSVVRRRHWTSSDEDDLSSTDDEGPIIIPSRPTSFALPDPIKPSRPHPFHELQRSVSERSTTSYTSFRRGSDDGHDADSDVETIVNEPTPTGKPIGDAASELQKVREARRGHQWSTSKPKRLSTMMSGNASFGGLYPNQQNVSPTTMTDASLPTPSTVSRTRGVRCVCNRAEAGRNEALVQCESCEFFVHERCVNVTEGSIYICSFCMTTPNEHIMATHNIVVFGGDHCGPEVLKAIEEYSPEAGKFNLQDHLLGGASIDAHKSALTDEALAAAKSADAVLLGAIGGPEWGPSSPVRPEEGILKLRKELGTYGNLRPCNFASESLVDSSPLKAEVCRGTDFIVVRELTGGIYFGDRTEDDGSGFAMDTEPYSRPEIERIARLAGFLALAKSPPAKVWSLDKANVLATSRLWRKVVTEVFAKEFPQLEVAHQLIDSAAMLMVKNPRALNGVVITSNLFGDIISDEASVIPGSIGLLPSASLGGIPDGKSKCNGIYEPIHGSAPDISGKGLVNPTGTILSVAMMLRYSLNLPKQADAVEAAVKAAIDNGTRTKDLGGNAGTTQMGDAVVAELVKILQA